MLPKKRPYRLKLEEALRNAAAAVHQARKAGEIPDGDRSHPAMKLLETLAKKSVDARARAIRRLKNQDQDQLVEQWKFFRRNHPHGDGFEQYRELNLHFHDHPHPEITAIKKRISDQMGLIDQKVKAAINPPLRVFYCAYRSDELGVPIDNLDEIAVEGRVVFIHNPDLSEIPYRSQVIENPTWLQTAQLANEMLGICEIEDHRVLENVYVEKEIEGIKEVEFVMGS